MALRVPVSTYRLQFNPNFRFADARALVPYLHQLGITDVYASPLLQARRGSTHGYDVTNPAHLNPELGTDEEFDALVLELQSHDMGLLLDIVPNHMSASSENPWWMDLLENGPRSPYASHFDVDWHPPTRSLDNRVLLPILGKPYAQALEDCELVLTFEAGAFFVNYFDFKLPVTMRTYRQILEHRLDRLQHRLGPDTPAFQDLQGMIATLGQLPSPITPSSDGTEDRRQREEIKERLGRLYATNEEVQRFVDRNVRTFNGKKGLAASFLLLDRLLSEQAYVLTFWQTANQEINYRRFFTISELVGLRIGDPMTFESSHAVPVRLAGKGMVTGFRIDHIDGLRDPEGYLRKLQERMNGHNGRNSLPFYVVLEKILSGTEKLASEWPVQGTTGYDFLNAVNGLFVDRDGTVALEGIYREFTDASLQYHDLVYLKKKQVMSTMLLVEMRSLGHYLSVLALQDRYAREIPRDELTRVLIETTACMPIYRTYLRNFEISRQDRHFIESALNEAQRRNPGLSAGCFAFLRQVLLLEPESHVLPEQREQRLAFVMSWQQLTGPITAKGLEDSVLYIYNRLISMNEVGGSPVSSGLTPDEFHAFLQQRHQTWPFTMNASMTHDAKHAEDFRARINVLSEIPEDWKACVTRWKEWNADKRKQVGTRQVPEANEEMLLYQTLLGSWPVCECDLGSYRQRIQDFMIKAGREAMVNTRWTIPNLEHEQAVTEFLTAILEPGLLNHFLPDLREFARRISFHGVLNSLAQLIVKVASPGVADFYQGSELWDLRLVDPDNRSLVDFQSRVRKQESIAAAEKPCSDLLSHWQDGAIKLFVMQKALADRRARGELFLKGKYIPLAVAGPRQDCVFAFARQFRRSWSTVVVPRLTTRLVSPGTMPVGEAIWEDTMILLPRNAPRRWEDVLTEGSCETTPRNGDSLLLVRDALRDLPVAMLRNEHE